MLELGMIEVSLLIGAYLLGSISSAIVVCRVMGLDDPRKDGSGNPGATNVKRLYGTKPAVITLVGDTVKGVIPVVLAMQLGLPDFIVILTGLLVFLGHLYPVFFQFKGGKGVATMMGVMLALSLPIGLSVVLTWLFVAKVLKVSSLSALVATALAPLYIYGLGGAESWIWVTALMTVILFWRHKSNIQRLVNGEEGLFKKPK